MEPVRSGSSLSHGMRVAFVLILAALSLWLLYTIRDTLVPFLVAFVLSYILAPIVDRLEAHGLNRMAGVLVVYACVIGAFALLLFLFVPVLVDGLQDMKQRVVGGVEKWACEVRWDGAEPLTLEGFACPTHEFALTAPSLPATLPAGSVDTLTFMFLPVSAEARRADAALTYRVGSQDPERLRFRFTGNAPPAEADPSAFESDGFRVAGTTHAFGNVDPGYVNNFRAQVARLEPQLKEALPFLEGVNISDTISRRLQGMGTDLVRQSPALVGSLISGMTLLVIVPIVGLFFLGQGRAIKRAFIEMVPNPYFEMVLNLIHRIDVQLGGYIRGLVLSVILISLLSITGLKLIGLNDYVVVGTIAGVANVIPYLGPIIGIVTGVVAAVMQYSSLDPGVWLPVVGVFACVQIFDNVFVAPVVVARSVNLHPLVVIFVVLVGNQLFGAVGMLMAVPVSAVVKVSVQTLYEGLRSYTV